MLNILNYFRLFSICKILDCKIARIDAWAMFFAHFVVKCRIMKKIFIQLSITLIALSSAKAESFLFSEDFSHGVDVVVLGDYHLDVSENELFGKVLLEVLEQSPQLDCILLEHPQDLQPYMKQFLSGKITWNQYSHRANDIFKSKYDTNFRSHHPEFNFNSAEGLAFFANKKALAEQAKAHKLKIFDIDTVTSENLLASVSERNAVMSARMAELFTSGQCHQALFPVGNAHIGCDLIGANLVWKSYDFDREGTRTFFKCDRESCNFPKLR